jgi:pimeloyl-ACP methyl ester carboxylesterase
LDPAKFAEYFAPDLATKEAQFMAASQVTTAAADFNVVIKNAAWRTKPSWMLVAGGDRIINPALERWYAERAKCRKVEVVEGASHVVYVSRPERVAALIDEAASSVK